jgi:tetratricopeptide (TPR) repeat protein
MALYRAERFSEAALALDRLGKRGGKAGADAASKARLVRTFADEWGAAEKAVRARRAKEAVSALQRASSTDRKLGGLFRDRIDQQLAEQSYTVAIQAFNRQAYDEAIEANARVLQLMPGHPQAPRLQDKMRKSAGLILREGQRALADGDREAAQRLARALIKLLPRDDANQRPARDLLARAGG